MNDTIDHPPDGVLYVSVGQKPLTWLVPGMEI